MDEVRITLAVAALLRIFLDDVSAPRYGYDLMRETGFASGKLYPVLGRLAAAGWLIAERERIDPRAAGRPPRRHYRLSPGGAQAAARELAAVNAQVQPRGAATSQRPQSPDLARPGVTDSPGR